MSLFLRFRASRARFYFSRGDWFWRRDGAGLLNLNVFTIWLRYTRDSDGSAHVEWHIGTREIAFQIDEIEKIFLQTIDVWKILK